MDKLKNIPVADSGNSQDERKPYTPPTAEVILLMPEEALAVWDYKYHSDEVSDRWALDGWGYNVLNHASGGVQGTLQPSGWELPTDK